MQTVPVVVGALGSVTMRLRESVNKLVITLQTRFLLKTALLGTARIQGMVFEGRRKNHLGSLGRRLRPDPLGSKTAQDQSVKYNNNSNNNNDDNNNNY